MRFNLLIKYKTFGIEGIICIDPVLHICIYKGRSVHIGENEFEYKLINIYVYEYKHTNQKVTIQFFYSKLESGNEKSEMIETKDDTSYIIY